MLEGTVFQPQPRDRLVGERARGGGLLNVDEQYGEAAGAGLGLGGRNRPGHKQHVAGTPHTGDPDLLAAHQEVGAVPAGVRRDLERVASRVRFCDGEAGLQLARGEPREQLAFLFPCAVPGDGERAEARGEKVNDGRGSTGPRCGKRLRCHRELEQALAAPAVVLRHAQPEPATLGQIRPDLFGPTFVLLAAVPVAAVMVCADLCDALAHGRSRLRQVEVHVLPSWRSWRPAFSPAPGVDPHRPSSGPTLAGPDIDRAHPNRTGFGQVADRAAPARPAPPSSRPSGSGRTRR